VRYLGMVGLTVRRGKQQGLERYTFSAEEQARHMRALHDACDFLESVYLATCNRVEVIFLCRRGTSVSEYRKRIHAFFTARDQAGAFSPSTARAAAQALHAYEKDGAAEHLFCVAAGLDSLNPGDAQILGQVKDALGLAQSLGLAGPRLRLVFEEAFQAAKRVRSKTALGARPISMISLAFDLIDQRTTTPTTVALIGAGETTRLCGEHLAGRPGCTLLFVNRTVSKVVELAAARGGRAVALDAFLAAPGHVDVIVTATSAHEPLLGRAFFSALEGTAPLVIDLAVPRDTDVQAAAAAAAQLYDIDRLTGEAERNRRDREAEIAEARVIIDEALEALRRRIFERDISPIVRDMRSRGQAAADELLKHLFNNGLVQLNETHRDHIRRFGQQVVNRLMHMPTVGLKRLAQDHGMEAVEAFLQGVRDDSREP
jgi:glutamyl-tRNA reductase